MNELSPDPEHAMATSPCRLSVLLLDVDAELRALLEVILDEDGRFSVVGQAADGAEALRLAREERPDVVVLDLVLPRMDGLSTLPRLREALPRAHIVVVSAFPDPYTLLDAVQRGADGYIDKSRVWCELVPTLGGLCAMV